MSAAVSDLPTGVPADQSDPHSTSGFSGFALPAVILRAIREMGFEQPTEIQQASIPALLMGRDVTGVAQTGTGKTAAYGLPLLAAINPNVSAVQALVLVPTRELAIQVTDALTAFAVGIKNLDVVAIYGGAPMHRQIAALRHGSQVVVGTPGRVIDLIERRALRLETVTFAVLDEADEMLRMGFAEDVDRILTEVPAQRQTALFSATMPKEIRRVAATHLNEPIDVSVAASATPVSNIVQQYAVLPFRDKATALQRIIAVADVEAAVVFVRTRSACDELGSALISAGVKAAFISGDVSQNERERTIDRLRSGQVDVLVATDVAARGMDVERLGLVVNFDAPSDPETYIHRVGRTGRAGRPGLAVTFFTPKETSRLRFIEKTIGSKLTEIEVPSAADVRSYQATAALGAAAERHSVGHLDAYERAFAAAAARTGIAPEALAAALLAGVVGDDGTTPIELDSARRRFEERGHEGRDARYPRRDDRAGSNSRFPQRSDRQGRGNWSDEGASRGSGDRYAGKGNADRSTDRYAGSRNAADRGHSSRGAEDRGHTGRASAPYRATERSTARRPELRDAPRQSKPRWDQARRDERADQRPAGAGASASRPPRDFDRPARHGVSEKRHTRSAH